MAQIISRRLSIQLFAIVLCCVLSACGGAPVQEMSNARQAIRAAHDAGAERIAPDPLTEAHTYLQQAEASLNSRKYRDARRQAVAARDKAVEALDAVQRNPRPEPG
jgi:hypothetical protein